jgi:hypothetical protein
MKEFSITEMLGSLSSDHWFDTAAGQENHAARQ